MRGAVALLALAAAVPALAADDQTIAAQDWFYDPPSVTIDVGDTVTLDNLGGTHNFHFSDGTQLPPLPATNGDPAWNNLTKTFTTAGTYSFFCDQHPTLMKGTVKVVDPNASPS